MTDIQKRLQEIRDQINAEPKLPGGHVVSVDGKFMLAVLDCVEALEFYANPCNWARRDSMFWESIDRDDCKDYPHITRDVRLTGGKRAREALRKLSGVLK